MDLDAIQATPATSWWKRRANLYFAPALLLVVAGIQVYRCAAYQQTPWKGGGFGMFSTADSQSARFLRCYLVTPRGEERVAVPKFLQKRAVLTRTVPTPANVEGLARSLASSTWVLYEHQLLSMAADILDTVNKLEPGSDDAATKTSSDPPSGADRARVRLPAAPGSSGRHPRFRAKEPTDPAPKPSDTIPFSAVRVELWRYQFDPKTCQLHCWKAQEASAPSASP